MTAEQKVVIPKDIKVYLENYIKLLIQQSKIYLPFVKTAFPASKSLADANYNLIAGNALSIFLNQYAMRMKYPTLPEFEEFGKIIEKYRNNIEKLF